MMFFSYLISEGRDEYNTVRKMLKPSLVLRTVEEPLALETMSALTVGSPGLAIRQIWV